ncbi:ferrous iron transporter B [Blastochloris viridis]|uniref:Ferrous iron transport protein B n=1 Tax=Blastochloris viridis TaxID=1079 RepID=A0A0H5BHC7_BLAVI|nr:ferrous iron transporter B [Blastochloris viridis]ALK09567.1 Ferrous iron transport protein B [Blastochloris viridis]BAS00545.1 ferrous iron transport protein B [Blastochloris viridis]CUU42230.1 Ferrous iron transport protein B [Blastochloris viridis]
MPHLPRIALAGVPNCGKSALFNGLTGSRQKVANYAGATVERRWGRVVLEDGTRFHIVDLPGTYSLDAASRDQEITREVLLGRRADEAPPNALICVMDATNLRLHLRLVLDVKRLGIPFVVALNMVDLAERNGTRIDVARLSQELGAPVIPTVAVRRAGLEELRRRLPELLAGMAPRAAAADDYTPLDTAGLRALQKRAREIAAAVMIAEGAASRISRSLDAVLLHRVLGPLALLALVFVVFQAVFAWAETPMGWIDSGVSWLAVWVKGLLPEGWLTSLLADGVIAGVGSVIVFLPQILILFFFILLMEQSGYMARAAFIMDRLMRSVGLNGRAFLPLLSSVACAIPGIMATRVIDDPRDRLTTILVAPLMTCSARLPIYTLIIAAVIPNDDIGAGLGLQGLVLFGLYVAGIVNALVIAAILRLTVTRGGAQSFLMELPKYQLPALRDLALGLLSRAKSFLTRAGTTILLASVALWLLASFPEPPDGATEPAIYYSFAAMIGRALSYVFAPVGFTWEMCIALVPGMAAREVAVGALGTVYALAGTGESLTASLVETLRNAWSLPTALAFLAWYVYAPMCFSTLAVSRRETNSRGWTVFQFGYLMVLAYVAAGATYWIARALA